MQKEGKVIIFSAPSGSGKSTLIHHLMQQGLPLTFSVSATSRAPRGQEQHGKDYFFMTPDEFRGHIQAGDFVEYEQVYAGCYYGTLKSQVEEKLAAGWNVLFDVDVVGGCNLKKYYGPRALSIFVQPPSIEALRSRLVGRATDTPQVIEQRLAKAGRELEYAPRFDRIVVNDRLDAAQAEALAIVKEFIDAR